MMLKRREFINLNVLINTIYLSHSVTVMFVINIQIMYFICRFFYMAETVYVQYIVKIAALINTHFYRLHAGLLGFP